MFKNVENVLLKSRQNSSGFQKFNLDARTREDFESCSSSVYGKGYTVQVANEYLIIHHS
jgi:hypothetical protein